jgi:pimeloyl-ACP methyl ester carboxylesterase
MRLFARSGNPSRALQQYEECRTILRHELEIEPSPRTRALRDSIRQAAAREDPPDGPELDVPLPPIHHAQTDDGAVVAYWTLGDGGLPLVSMPSLPHSHLRSEWEAPEWRGHFLRLARERAVVRYDPRSVGASPRGEADFSLEACVADLEAVVRAAELDRFAIWAPIHSGAAAMTYAARNPHRVAALILWCCYARGADLRPHEELTSLRRLLTADWHVYSESAAQFFFAWEHQRLARHYAALIRESTDAETARLFPRAAMEYDVSDLLPNIRIPALVMHRRDMPWLSTDLACQLAEALPCGDLRMLEGSAAVPWVGDAEEIEAMVNEFLTQTSGGVQSAIA